MDGRGVPSLATREARMLTRTRTRRMWFGGPGAWALALVVMAPAAAQAQQTGLFPLQPIKRERVPCPMEDPVYRKYRHEFYGYHPTAWRRFPTGWGFPSPEGPNEKKAFEERKRDTPKSLDDLGGMGPDGAAPGPDGGMPGPGGRPSPNAPPELPRGRSPFELEAPRVPGEPPGAAPGADPNTPPAPAPAPRAEGSGSDAGAILAPPSTGASDAAPPALAVPDPTAATAPMPGSPPNWAGGPITANPSAVNESNASGFQPAKRRNFLGDIFSGRVFRR
jgi:hypothetical protein